MVCGRECRVSGSFGSYFRAVLANFDPTLSGRTRSPGNSTQTLGEVQEGSLWWGIRLSIRGLASSSQFCAHSHHLQRSRRPPTDDSPALKLYEPALLQRLQQSELDGDHPVTNVQMSGVEALLVLGMIANIVQLVDVTGIALERLKGAGGNTHD